MPDSPRARLRPAIVAALGIWVLGAAGPPDPKEPKPADPSSPESVLNGKGLRRSGSVYILEQENEILRLQEARQKAVDEYTVAQQQAFGIEQKLVAIGDHIATKQAEYTGLLVLLDSMNPRLPATSTNGLVLPGNIAVGKNANGSENPDQANTERLARITDPAFFAQEARKLRERAEIVSAEIVNAQQQSANLKNAQLEYSAEATRRRGEAEQLDANINDSFRKLLREYEDLAKDATLRAALNEINKTARPPVTLGPIWDYRRNLKRFAIEDLRDQGILAGRGQNFEFAPHREVRRALVRCEKGELSLRIDLQKLDSRDRQDADRARRLERLEAQTKRLDDQWERAEPRSRTKKELADERERMLSLIGKQRDEAALAEKARRKLDAKYGQDLERFVEDVDALKAAMVKAEDGAKKLLANPDVQRIQESLGGKNRVRQAIGSLTAYESRRAGEFLKMVAKAPVQLEPDKTVCWILADLNGKPAQRMVLDPGVESIRLTESRARGLGVMPAEGRPTIEVQAPDGTTLKAKRVSLESVRVGSLTLKNIECLIVPEGHGAPAVFGVKSLKGLVSRVARDEQPPMLILSRVTIQAAPPPRPMATERPKAGSLKE